LKVWSASLRYLHSPVKLFEPKVQLRPPRWFLAAFSLAALLFFARPPARPAGAPSHAEVALDWSKINQEAIEKLCDYIRVDTSNPPGSEIRAAEWYAKIFDAEGIAYEMAESAPGRGNVAARLKGTGSEPALILLNHMDVVPVSREFWTVDPFGGVQRDGYIWGRGAEDMKSLGVAQLIAFLELHREHVPLRRDVIFLGTADEEAGGKSGAGWVVLNRPNWISGASFLLTEGAQSRVDDKGRPIYFGVGPTEKTPGWLKLTATGRSGHGSVPIPDSAVNRLIAALDRLRSYRAPLEVTPPIESALRSLAPYETEPWRTRFRNLREFIASPGAYNELSKRPAILALLTNTISITGLEGTKKINIIPPSASALLDCRLLPGWTIERWQHEVRKIIQDDSIRIETVLNFPSAASPINTLLYTDIQEAVKQLHPGAGVAQSVETGFTDSHFFRERNIVSYGFEPFALSEADTARVHGNDERIPVDAYRDGVRLLWEVVYNFSRTE
jgi:acetylornithine deacetylase/succinyl-diaminopimelate desuccinylase-like protein